MSTLSKLEEKKIKLDNAYLTEVKNNFKLTQQIQKYEDQSLTTQMLAEAKKSIWNSISENITDLWSTVQIIFEKEELVQNVKVAFEKTKIEIENRVIKSNRIIKMWNSKTQEEFEELEIQDKTCTIMEVKRVLTNKNLMVKLENKFKEIELQVKRFNWKITLL